MGTSLLTLEGARTELSEQSLSELRMQLRGEALTPRAPRLPGRARPVNAMHANRPGTLYRRARGGLADEGADAGIKDAFGRNLSRLAEVQATYDPANFFRRNNNILPAA